MRRIAAIALLILILPLMMQAAAQPTTVRATPPKIKVIFDTDIGDDIDDAFALALLVSTPSVEILGVTTAWGDTALRARLTARLLSSIGRPEITIYAGPKTPEHTNFTQARYASMYPPKDWPDATAFTLDAIRRNPGEITLIAVSPFSNMGALIDKDPVTFRKLKQVVLMGGSIHRGYGDLGYTTDPSPSAEYNIFSDIASARKLFASGVPIAMMPLDSTQLKLDEVKREVVFSHGSPLTDNLALLYHQWSASTGYATPTLFDAMAVAAALDPSLCPTTPMRIAIDDKGFTRVEAGTPNAQVCLQDDPEKFFRYYLTNVLKDSSR